MNRIGQLISFGAALALIGSDTGGCRKQISRSHSVNTPQSKPIASAAIVLDWVDDKGADWVDGGCSADYCFASARNPRRLAVWQWDSESPRQVLQLDIPEDCFNSVIWNSDKVAYQGLKDGLDGVFVREIKTTENAKFLESEKGWVVSTIGLSANGERCGVIFGEQAGDFGPPNRDMFHPRAKIGLIDKEGNSIKWVVTLVGANTTEDGINSSVMPSNNNYIAIANYGNSLVMVDAASERVIWKKKPFLESSIEVVAFSPDSEFVAAGGALGAIHLYETKSGTLIHSWFASLSGSEEASHRITRIAVSPNGKWVAAGTGPEGLVFVAHLNETRVLAVLNHGTAPIGLLQFSPNSNALASFASSTIKVWPSTYWSGSSSNATQPSD